MYEGGRTLERHHKVVERVLVLLVGLCIVLVHVFVYRLLHNLNRALQSMSAVNVSHSGTRPGDGEEMER